MSIYLQLIKSIEKSRHQGPSRAVDSDSGSSGKENSPLKGQTRQMTIPLDSSDDDFDVCKWTLISQRIDENDISDRKPILSPAFLFQFLLRGPRLLHGVRLRKTQLVRKGVFFCNSDDNAQNSERCVGLYRCSLNYEVITIR